MNSINVSNLDPLTNDSMDPNDPTSIMYDPSLAEKGSTSIIYSNSSISVDSGSDFSENADNSDASVVNQNSVNDSRTSNIDQDADLARKLRKFGKMKI